jgi:hypothetical protein
MNLHHFPAICVDAGAYTDIDNIKDFVKISRLESSKQTYYFSPADKPERGPNKYFGDAGEYFAEVLLNNSQIDKRINCSGYRPAAIDEFGIDGEGYFTVDSGLQQRLGVQIKIGVNNQNYYDSNNSNILAAVAAIPAFGFDGLLFVNFGAGVSPGLLQILNQKNTNLVRQLNYNDLDRLTRKNTAFWDLFREGLVLTTV